MQEQIQSDAGGQGDEESVLRVRLDPRTGRLLTVRRASFWRDHETQRLAQGLTLSEYASANGLKFSTFRRWGAKLAARGDQRNHVAGGAKATSRKPVEPAHHGGFLAITLRQGAHQTQAELRLGICARTISRRRLREGRQDRWPDRSNACERLLAQSIGESARDVSL